ncbi:hypothetical protein FSP39_019893 [Pinctada imbricata]|uniref:Uncharacterized protein n=1 Tax=Pinctada imbricata TaxID=66713 RepID=A0AA89BRK4_PINIB|nr:hypothetical protein FSP39_019893 [Pinctada imbricata]
MDGHLTPEYIDENGMYDGRPFAGYGYGPDMGDEYEPYARPESNMGFINQGEPVDEFGRPFTPYGQMPPDPYGQMPPDHYDQMPPDHYGQMPPDHYGQMPPDHYGMYVNGDDDPYQYGYGNPR